jgi:hypothetical protein
MKDDTYYFHQTPNELAKQLIKFIPFDNDDKVLEPFKGEGSFYNNFPDNVQKDFCEIEEGLDYKDYDKEIDWVISNPPFKINDKNSVFPLTKFYANKVKKGIAFLVSDYGLCTLTPIRLKELNETYGLFIHKIIVCSIKKWRGRYFFIIFKKQLCEFYTYIEGNF